jgi:hypothetical protein
LQVADDDDGTNDINVERENEDKYGPLPQLSFQGETWSFKVKFVLVSPI